MNSTAQLLSEATNFAVVQLPGRKYPGVVMQGDSLHSIAERLRVMKEELAKGNSGEVLAELDDIVELFSHVLSHYEAICAQRHLELPYK